MFWLVPDATLSDTGDWLDENPAGGLLSVWGEHRPDNMNSDGMYLGYIPEQGAEEGIVYTLRTVPGGIAVRAEIAAQTADASAPNYPMEPSTGHPGWDNNPTRRAVWAHSAFGVGNARCGSAIVRR